MSVGLREFREKLTEHVESAQAGTPVIVDKHGRHIVVLWSYDEWQRWQFDDMAEQMAMLQQRYGVGGPELLRRLVLEKSYNRGDGSSKDEKLDSIKGDTVRLPDIQQEIAEIRQLIAPMLERLMSLEAAKAVGCDCAAGFDDEGMEVMQDGHTAE